MPATIASAPGWRLDAEGEILAMDVEDVTAIGAFSAYPRTSVVEGNQVYPPDGRALPFKNYRADLQVVFQNKVQMSQYRAVGHPIACAVTERLVDMAAGKARPRPLRDPQRAT